MQQGKEEPDFTERLLERLYDCRKVEIEHLWQRSVFLGTFIVLAFSGYGLLVGKMLEMTSLAEERCLCDFWETAHLLGMLCGFILVFLGTLWICMAKGSKRWQELYERKIVLLEDRVFQGKGLDQFRYKCEFRQLRKGLSSETEIMPSYCDCKYCKRENCSQKPDYGKDLARSKCFLSLGPGPYSPSKINVMLGWFICLTGIGILGFHYIKSFNLDWDSWIFSLFLWGSGRGAWIIVLGTLGMSMICFCMKKFFQHISAWLKKEKWAEKWSCLQDWMKKIKIVQIGSFLYSDLFFLFSSLVFAIIMTCHPLLVVNAFSILICIGILIFLIQLVLKHKLDENEHQK